MEDVCVKKLVALNYIVNALLMERFALKNVLALSVATYLKIKMKSIMQDVSEKIDYMLVKNDAIVRIRIVKRNTVNVLMQELPVALYVIVQVVKIHYPNLSI